jgi:hypothetical protein
MLTSKKVCMRCFGKIVLQQKILKLQKDNRMEGKVYERNIINCNSVGM